MMRDHPPKRTADGRGLLARTFGDLLANFKDLTNYPEACKFLVAHMAAQFGGPMFVTLISTYAPYQMERTGIMVSLIGLVVLVVGTPASLCFGAPLGLDPRTSGSSPHTPCLGLAPCAHPEARHS